jgi:hypothetical protein
MVMSMIKILSLLTLCLVAFSASAISGTFEYVIGGNSGVKGELVYHSEAFDTTEGAIARFVFFEDGTTSFQLRFTARERLRQDPNVNWRYEYPDEVSTVPIYQPTVNDATCAPGWETANNCRLKCAAEPGHFSLARTLGCTSSNDGRPVWLNFTAEFSQEQLSAAIDHRLIGIQIMADADYSSWYISDVHLSDKLCRHGLDSQSACSDRENVIDAAVTVVTTPKKMSESDLVSLLSDKSFSTDGGCVYFGPLTASGGAGTVESDYWETTTPWDFKRVYWWNTAIGDNGDFDGQPLLYVHADSESDLEFTTGVHYGIRIDGDSFTGIQTEQRLEGSQPVGPFQVREFEASLVGEGNACAGGAGTSDDLAIEILDTSHSDLVAICENRQDPGIFFPSDLDCDCYMRRSREDLTIGQLIMLIGSLKGDNDLANEGISRMSGSEIRDYTEGKNVDNSIACSRG